LTNYELAFLFNPQRANRLVQFEARAGTPGFDELVDSVLQRTWKAPLQTGLYGQIQLQTQQMVLTWMLGLSQNENANYAVKSLCFSRLQALKHELEAKISGATGPLRAHCEYAIERINKPKDIALPVHRELPPGAPIGCGGEEARE
jgi:hypothetical protein